MEPTPEEGKGEKIPNSQSSSLLEVVKSQYDSAQFRKQAKLELDKVKDLPNPLVSDRAQNALAGAGGTAAAVTAGITVTALSGGLAAVPVLVALGMGAIAGGGALGFNSTSPNTSVKVTLASGSKKEIQKWHFVLARAIDDNEGRAKKGSSLAQTHRAKKLQKPNTLTYRYLVGPVLQIHHRYRAGHAVVDMMRWLDPDQRTGIKWNDSIVIRGMRVLAERNKEEAVARFRMNLLGGARRTQTPVLASAPDVFVHAMSLGDKDRIKTLSQLGPFADIVHIKIPPTSIFWSGPFSVLGLFGDERHFICVRRWETNDDGAFILTFEPFDKDHEREWLEYQRAQEMERISELGGDLSQPIAPKDVPWIVKGRKYIARGVKSHFSTSLHACVTVSPARLELQRRERATSHDKRGGARKGGRIAHSNIAASPSSWRRLQTNDCLVKSTFLVRPGGYLGYIAMVFRFLFGSDVIGAYCEALLVMAIEDVKLKSENEGEGGGNRLSRSDSGNFVLKNNLHELKRKVDAKNEEVAAIEELISASEKFPVDQHLMKKLKVQLLERKQLKEELMIWSGESSSEGEPAQLPKHWISNTRKSKHLRGKGVRRSLSFLALYIGIKAVFELALQIESFVWLSKLMGWMAVDGDLLFLILCTFVGAVKMIEQHEGDKRRSH
ncbi:hypothetical protein TrLO_g5044 [Triparma laevis f. longispina]|uniref:Uncharacterized protein n=1 Tax=Triparma laevis f. longispina TaxID=1714387 RepID=A0A9W6ZH21_9STRA|nr:hypothetical protein TrLO_g5044 [Triparma laevis f. longispina]